MSNLLCPLCQSQKLKPVPHEQFCFHHCADCFLIFKDAKHHLSYEDEAIRYSTHQNSHLDTGYINFLNQLALPFTKYLSPQMEGIDFGCGPGPTFSKILKEKGFKQCDYDPIFFPELSKQKFDFLTATEVIEHFTQPQKSFEQINQLLNPKSLVGFMTSFYEKPEQIEAWYYVNDPTHVCFYHQKTMAWLAQKFEWQILELTSRTSIFQTR